MILLLRQVRLQAHSMFMIRCVVCSVLFHVSLVSHGQNLFETVEGFAADDNGSAGAEDATGNFVIVGSSQDISTGIKDFYVLKLSPSGDVIWSQKLGGAAAEEGFGAAVDGNRYLAFGYTASAGAGSNDFYLIKLREDASVVWAKTYGGTGSDIGRDVIVTADGGYAMTGYSNSPGTNGSFDGYLVKTDSAGGQDWEKWYGGAQFEFPIRLLETSDNGFVLAIESTSFGNSYQWYTIKTDSQGDTLWTRVFGTPGSDLVVEAAEAADSGIVLVGSTVSAIDSTQLTLIKYDKNGTLLWVKHPSLTDGDFPIGIKRTIDGGFVITGYTSTPDRNSQMLLLKVDTNGDLEWGTTFGGIGNETARHVIQTADGGYLLTGLTDGFGPVNLDLYAVKTGPVGEWPCPDSLSMLPGANETCEGSSVAFSNTTITSSEVSWYVDGVFQSDSWNYVHQFTSAGDHEVALVICSDTASVVVSVNALPDAGFTFNQSGNTFTFTLDDPATTAQWYFGDGDTSSQLNPVHTYQADGPFNVTVVVTDSNGCQSTSSQLVTLVGIEDMAVVQSVGPNPFTAEIVISLRESHPNCTATLRNAIGQIHVVIPLGQETHLMTPHLSPGLYWLTVSDGTSTASFPLIKLQ